MPRGSVLLLYVALILGMLPFTGGSIVGFAGPHRFDLLLTIAYFGAAAIAVHRVVLHDHLSDLVAFLLLAALALVAGALSFGLSVPEERVHFLEYALLYWLVRRALPTRWRPATVYGVAFGATASFAVLDETVQHLLEHRVGDVGDVLIDTVAAAAALVYDEAVHNRLGWRNARRKDQPWNASC